MLHAEGPLLSIDLTERGAQAEDVDDVLEWDYDAEERERGYYSQQDGHSKVKKISVLPHPYQDPYPIMWEPVGSPRSIAFAAESPTSSAPTNPGPRVTAIPSIASSPTSACSSASSIGMTCWTMMLGRSRRRSTVPETNTTASFFKTGAYCS